MHADRFRALLQEAGLVDDQHAVGVAEMLGNEGDEIIAHRLDIPVGGIEQALHALRPRLAEMFGELPAVLALDGSSRASR